MDWQEQSNTIPAKILAAAAVIAKPIHYIWGLKAQHCSSTALAKTESYKNPSATFPHFPSIATNKARRQKCDKP